MLSLEEKIKPMYRAGLGCRSIGHILDENPALIYKRVKKLGIVRGRLEAERQENNSDAPLFQQAPSRKNLKDSSLGDAIQWFLRRGYVVSLPVAVTFYDFVVESEQGLQRAQIKTTNRKEKSNRWIVGIGRKKYNAQAVPNAGGKTKQVPYTADEIDLFFIRTGSGEIYLIPLAAVAGKTTLVLDRKYADFLV